MPQPAEGRPAFALVRRGYDPAAVDARLAEAAARIAGFEARVAELEASLSDARELEQAIRITFQKATQEKRELLDAARREAEEIVQEARHEARLVRDEAKSARLQAGEQAERLVAEAKRSALALIEAGRVDAEEENVRLRAEHAVTSEHLAGARSLLSELHAELDAACRGAVAGVQALAERLDRHCNDVSEHLPPLIAPGPVEPAAGLEETTDHGVAEAAAVPDAQPVPPETPDAATTSARQDDLLAALESLTSR